MNVLDLFTFKNDARRSTLWDVCDGTGIDAYELADTDSLQLMWGGMALYAVKDAVAVVKKLGGDVALQELDLRAMKINRYACRRLGWRRLGWRRLVWRR